MRTLRDLGFLLLAAGAAIVATAGAFLLLASLATRPAETGAVDSIDVPEAPAEQRSLERDVLVVEPDMGEVEALDPAPQQRLTLRVRNTGDESLSGLILRVSVVPAGTPPGSEPRTYEEELGTVSPGEWVDRGFDLDLSPIGPPPRGGTPVPTEERAYLEIRATASGGENPATNVKTVVLTP